MKGVCLVPGSEGNRKMKMREKERIIKRGTDGGFQEGDTNLEGEGSADSEFLLSPLYQRGAIVQTSLAALYLLQFPLLKGTTSGELIFCAAA